MSNPYYIPRPSGYYNRMGRKRRRARAFLLGFLFAVALTVLVAAIASNLWVVSHG